MPTALLICSLTYELVSTQSMSILSGLYRAVSANDVNLFQKTLQEAILIVLGLALLKAISNYLYDLCAIKWRTYIVERIHQRYAQYAVNLQNGTACNISTKDQRITQDVDRLTMKAAKLCSEVVVLPAVIAYYTCYLLVLFGWFTPASCFLYFLFGSCLCYFFAVRLVDVVCAQEQLEGEFRHRHAQAQQHAEEVYLLRGEAEEVRRMHSLNRH